MTIIPRIRTVNALPATHEGRQMVLLQDPLGIAKKSVLIPAEITPLLMLCDGTRRLEQIHSDMFSIYGFDVHIEDIRAWLNLFEEAALLDSETFHLLKQRAVEDYRASESRQMTLADDIYPAKQDDLRQVLEPYLQNTSQDPAPEQVSGLICPHIDYFRGWRVYAEVMAQACASIQEAELIIVLGTDHFDDGNPLSLTLQDYQTPYGLLQTPEYMVRKIADSLEDIDVFEGELRHRYEHSIELALVWLHHMRGGTPCEVLPVLCGGHELLFEENQQKELAWVQTFINSMKDFMREKKTIIIAAADLAHVGLAFGGDAIPLDQRSKVALVDEQLLQTVKRGDHKGFIDEIFGVNDRYNVCGTTPIYLLLRLLEPTSAQVVSYELCPADENETSWVSICGALIL